MTPSTPGFLFESPKPRFRDNPKKKMKKKTDCELVLEFCVELSRLMIVSGANLERVQLAIEYIFNAYGYPDFSLYLLNNYISLSVTDSEGAYCSRQSVIAPTVIHLERLKRLNDLSFQAAREKPSPKRLRTMLNEALKVKERPDWQILLGRVLAFSSLGMVVGGDEREILSIAIVVFAMHFIMKAAAKPGLNRLLTNALIMWLTTVAAIFVMYAGLCDDAPIILISVAKVVIPGIPLVNAVRNLLCGNEMNGIRQAAKAFIETMALAMGIYLAFWMFGLQEGMKHAVVVAGVNPLWVIPPSFLASVGFGIFYRIPNRDLWIAGLGGALTRILLILLIPITPSRLVYITIAALAAGLFAEALATLRRYPSNYFMYPAIVPLIPSDLFYYTLVGIYTHDAAMISANAMDCLMTLLGMSIGFVLSSILAHYIRKTRLANLKKEMRQ